MNNITLRHPDSETARRQWRAGFAARRAELGPGKNPNSEGTLLHLAWAQGWADAHDHPGKWFPECWSQQELIHEALEFSTTAATAFMGPDTHTRLHALSVGWRKLAEQKKLVIK